MQSLPSDTRQDLSQPGRGAENKLKHRKQTNKQTKHVYIFLVMADVHLWACELFSFCQGQAGTWKSLKTLDTVFSVGGEGPATGTK